MIEMNVQLFINSFLREPNRLVSPIAKHQCPQPLIALISDVLHLVSKVVSANECNSVHS